MKFLRVMVLLFMFTISSSSQAQAVIEAQFALSNATPLVGEPVELTLTVTTTREIVIQEWPNFDRDWETFSVLDIGELEVNETEAAINYTQVYRLAFWYPGEYSTPDIFIGYETPMDDGTQQLEVAPAFLSIPSVLEGENLSLRPLKPQIWLPYLSPLVIGAAVLGAGGLLFGGYRWRKLRQSQTTALDFDAELLDNGSPAHVALSELKRIYTMNLAPEVVYAEVADCLRVYIQAQFEVSTLDLTTDELIDVVRKSSLPLPDDLQHELRRMLQQADLAKFARYQPNERNAKGYINAAGKWIQVTDDMHQPESLPKDGVN